MKKEIINYRRKRAKESLEEAKIMFENVKLFATVNRIYYAIFYEAVALLLTKGLYSSKHSGIRSLFNREFVKTGVVGEAFGDFFNKMFEFRQRGDYEDFVEFKKEDVNLWFKKAKEFIQAIEEVIVKAIEEQK